MSFYFLKLTESRTTFTLRVDRLMDRLVPALHCTVICPFCNTKKVTFSRPADFKNHILKRHKETIVSFNVPEDTFFSENNCFWISSGLQCIDPWLSQNESNSKASSKLRTLILYCIKKIVFTPKRSRQKWLKGLVALA